MAILIICISVVDSLSVEVVSVEVVSVFVSSVVEFVDVFSVKVLLSERSSAISGMKIVSTCSDVFPDKSVALIEGANMVSRHTKPNSENPDGGIIKKEAPINLSNLMLVDSKGKASRTGIKIDKKTGKKNRYFKKTGEIVK